MYEPCGCEGGNYCSRYSIRVSTREHQFLMGTSGLPRYKEEIHVARLLGEAPPPAPPGLLQKAVNFSKAVVRHVFAGSPKLDDAAYQERLAICAACEDYCDKSVEGWRCTHVDCGCRLQEGDVMPGKARWASEDCPLGRWPLKTVLTSNQSGGCGCQ